MLNVKAVSIFTLSSNGLYDGELQVEELKKYGNYGLGTIMSTVNDQNRSLDLLFSKLTHWVNEQPDIHALALVGSYARQEAKPTSDIDLVVFVDDPQKYLSDFSWANQFGTIEKSQLEYYGKVTSLRILYMES